MNESYLLTQSIRIFILHNTGSDDEILNSKPLNEHMGKGNFNGFDILLAIIMWEVHHGLNLDLNESINLSIDQLVEQALNEDRLDRTAYDEHIKTRLELIDDLSEKIYNDFDNEVKQEGLIKYQSYKN